MDFVGTDPVLAVDQKPHHRQPLGQRDGGVLHNRTSLQSELWGVVLLPAVPAVVLLQKQHVLTSALGADNAIRPAPRHEVFAAVGEIGEVDNRVLKCLRFHESTLPNGVYFVKYVITKISAVELCSICYD